MRQYRAADAAARSSLLGGEICRPCCARFNVGFVFGCCMWHVGGAGTMPGPSPASAVRAICPAGWARSFSVRIPAFEDGHAAHYDTRVAHVDGGPASVCARAQRESGRRSGAGVHKVMARAVVDHGGRARAAELPARLRIHGARRTSRDRWRVRRRPGAPHEACRRSLFRWTKWLGLESRDRD